MQITITKEELIDRLFKIISDIVNNPKVNSYTLITKQQQDELVPIHILIEVEHQLNVVLGEYKNLRFSTVGEIVDFVLSKILFNG